MKEKHKYQVLVWTVTLLLTLALFKVGITIQLFIFWMCAVTLLGGYVNIIMDEETTP